MRLFRYTAALFVVATIATFAPTASAQTIPFVIAGSGEIFEGSLPLAPGTSAPHNIELGFATKLGFHTGEGAFELVTGPDENLAADFQSTVPFKFTSTRNPSNVLALNYGVTEGVELPAAQPGTAQFISIDSGESLDTPFDDTFIIVFLAEFNPELDECSGIFRRGRLKDGSVTVLAFSGPVVLSSSGVISANATTENPFPPIPYSWYGAGSLKFKWPFGWF